MRKVGKSLVAILLGFIFLIGCESQVETNSETQTNNEGLQVVASIYPMYEVTQEIVGNRGDVALMVGPSEDAHHYEPSAQAVASVNEADVFVYSSDEMEFWADSLLAVVENDHLQVVELGEGIDFTIGEEAGDEAHHEDDTHEHNHEEAAHDHGNGHDHGALDPHFWLNPAAIDSQLNLIVEALSEQDPAGAEEYEQNTADFSNELKALDEAYKEAFAGATDRTFVVQHQAFGHLAAQYDLHQVAVGGLTTEVEPDPRQLADIVDFVSEQNVPVIYYQSGENSAIAETIAAETGTEIGVLHDLESAPTNLSEEENGYLEAMYENLEQLTRSVN